MLRDATDDDNDALLALLGRVEMGGELAVVAQRAPDFFALHRMQSGKTHCVVHDGGDRIDGVGVLSTRESFLFGRRARIGMVCDLRADRRARLGRAFRESAATMLVESADREGCEAVFATLMAENASAKNAFVHRAIARGHDVRLMLQRRYETVCVPLVRLGGATSTPGIRIARAQQDDVPAIERFLDDDHRTRPLGYDFASGEFRRRLARWPGFSLENTWVASTALGTVTAVASVWDAAPVRRYRITSQSRTMRLLHLATHALARLRGGPCLPTVGDEVRTLFLTNMSVKNDDADVLRALVAHIHAAYAGGAHHFLMFPLFDDDPLEGAMSGGAAWQRFSWRMPFELHRLVRRDASPLVLVGRPGFEIALA